VGKLYYGKNARNTEESISGHVRIFTHAALKELLQIHGFKVLKSFGEANPYILSCRMLKPAELLFGRSKTMASYLCLICQKGEL
jgi:hypothetical protein